MTWLITTFYNVRFLKKNQLALSTAMFSPSWFCKAGKHQIFLDKNGVINGLSISEFVSKQNHGCPCSKKDQQCCYLREYEEQLMSLDFKSVISKYETLAEQISSISSCKIDEIVLLVYEKPENLCSERVALKKLFEKNGMKLNELEVKK